MPPQTNVKKTKVWSKELQSCNKCDISKYCDHKVTYFIHSPRISPFIDILFIGEAPGESEYTNKEPFIGPSGQTLRAILDEALEPDISYCITNSILCTPFTSDSRYTIRTPSLSEVRECTVHLTTLCKQLQPKHVIALGKIAEKAIVEIRKKIILPTSIYILHPSMISQAKDYNYQFDKAVLTIQEYLKR
jgi:uracil-DNA glycosylase family 4